jgi:hypothetical protein
MAHARRLSISGTPFFNMPAFVFQAPIRNNIKTMRNPTGARVQT